MSPALLSRRRLAAGPRRRGMRGLSLLEVLIVLLLFSFGLLGIVGLQARAHQLSTNAEDQTRAALLVEDLATAMWSAQAGPLDAALNAGTIADWQLRVANPAVGGLPGGVGTVAIDGRVARVTITWQPPQQASGDLRRYVSDIVR